MPNQFPQISHLAQLARLNLAPAEKTKFSRELASVLDYVNQLKEAEAKPSSETATFQPSWREDKIESAAPETIQQILENAPEKEGRLLKVKAVF